MSTAREAAEDAEQGGAMAPHAGSGGGPPLWADPHATPKLEAQRRHMIEVRELAAASDSPKP